MGVDLQKFKQLYERLFEIGYNGGSAGHLRFARQRRRHPRRDVESAPFLPLTYQDHFAAALEDGEEEIGHAVVPAKAGPSQRRGGDCRNERVDGFL